MSSIKIIIDNEPIILPAGTTILAGIKIAKKYVPTLCSHPNLPPAYFKNSVSTIYRGKIKMENTFPYKKADQCGLCIVEVETNKKKQLVLSCLAEARAEMTIQTNNKKIKKERRKSLLPILSKHKHSCITCSQNEGCSQSQCSSNVPEIERCCPIFNRCEFKNIVNFVGIPQNTPKWIPTNIPSFNKNSLIKMDYNLCIGCTRCVRICSEIRNVGIINFVWTKQKILKIGTSEISLSNSKCRFCSSCIEICPTGSLQDKIIKNINKKEKDMAPCETSCPVHINIPNFLRMVSIQNFKNAIRILDEKIPFPKTLGKVCMHPCENECRRKELNTPIAICSIKSFIANKKKEKITIKDNTNSKKTGKKISIVGAGPAGLSAAYFLKKKGHLVTLYDSQKNPGGMLRYVIPRSRLPLNLLESEIKDILELGIKFNGEKELGRNLSLDDITKTKPDSILLSIGAQNDRKIKINGATSNDLMGAITFLKSFESKKKIKIGKKITIIGGGNVAMDVAMTAILMGLKKISVVCLENESEMPASKLEIKLAKKKGIKIHNSWAPHKISKKNGSISFISFIKCKSVFNSNKVFDPKYDYDTKKTIITDQIILAIGQELNKNSIGKININIKNGLISVNKDSFETNIPSVYAAGDAISLPGSVIKAISSGQKAAENINFFLGFKNKKYNVNSKKIYPSERINKNKNFINLRRRIDPQVKNGTEIKNFEETTEQFITKQIMQEAKRCLQCDLRLSFLSNQIPMEESLVLNKKNIYKSIPHEIEGVYKILNKNKKVVSIVGTSDIQKSLLSEIKEKKGEFFEFEKDKMYSKRESELIQKHLQKYGEMPGGNEIDDLF